MAVARRPHRTVSESISCKWILGNAFRLLLCSSSLLDMQALFVPRITDTVPPAEKEV